MKDWSNDLYLDVIKDYLKECAENEYYLYEQYQIDVLLHEYERQKQEIERLNKENKELEEIIGIRECQLEEMQESKTDYTQVNILEMKLEKLHSIIKEAREYIKSHTNNCMFELRIEEMEELLEILDKVEENK